MFSARVKVRKKDFCIVSARNQQACRDRAPLKHSKTINEWFAVLSAVYFMFMSLISFS